MMTKTPPAAASATIFVDAESKTPISHKVEEKQIMRGDIVQMSYEPSKKGRNVSGRSWKIRPQKRASTLIKTKINNGTKSWEERQREKSARKDALNLQSEL